MQHKQLAKNLQSRKNSRWNRELQRRLGSAPLWLVVSFTGRFDVELLRQVCRDGSTQTVVADREPTSDLTRQAQRARARLRWAESLRRKKARGQKVFNRQEQDLLHRLAAGTLRTEANEATQRSGFGRIKHADGTYEDIAPHTGGTVRTVLDHVEPNSEEEIDLYLGF